MGFKDIITGWVNDHQRKRNMENVERADGMLTDLILTLQKASNKMAVLEDQSLYNIKSEDLEQYLITLSALESALKDTGTLRIHVEEIDAMLKVFVDKVSYAIQQDYPNAAKYGMEAIAWGILVGRNDISEMQISQEEKIVTDRMKMLNAHRLCIEAAEDLDSSQQAFRKHMKRILEFRERKKEIKNAIQEDEDLYQELKDEKRLYGPEYSGSTSELKEMNNLLIKKGSVQKELNALTDQRDILEKKITALTMDLDNARISMTMLSVKFNEELPAQLKKLSEDVIQSIAETAKNLDELLEADSSLVAAMTSYVESPTVKSINAEAYRMAIEEEQREEKLRADKMKQEAAKTENSARKTILN